MGTLPFHRDISDIAGLKKPRTEIMAELGEPGAGSSDQPMLPCDGVGLARMEFVINVRQGAT